MRSRLGPWLLALSLLALPVAATVILWRPLGVFPPLSLRFWASTGTVLLAWGLALAGAFAAGTGRAALLVGSTVLPAFALQSLGFAGRFVFRDTVPLVWLGPAALGVLWSVAALPLLGTLPSRRRAAGVFVLSALLGTPVGLVQVLGRRPRTPAGTRPLGRQVPSAPLEAQAPRQTWSCAGRRLDVLPFLTFESTSRDGFWPRVGPADVLEGPVDAALSALRVQRSEAALELEATTELPHAVHSHLNRFLELQLRGFQAPALRLAAVGGAAFPLLPFDYPHGRPAQFATLLADGALLVARGTDAEKGPFVELGRGPVPASGVLEFELLDGSTPVARGSVDGFVAQADLGESPTAGSGIPANVVQFGVPPKQPAGEAVPVGVLHFSLAESGIGEGLDTVTHAAGRYWIHVRLDCVGAPPSELREPGANQLERAARDRPRAGE